MISYLCGYATHYILDRNLHPYVYNVEYKLKNKYKNTKAQILHKQIETDIDKRLIDIIRNMSTKEFRDYTVFDISYDTLTILSDMYKYSIKETFSYDISKNEIINSVNSARSIRKFLYDPSRIKLSIVKNLEKVFNKKIQFSSIIYKNKYTYDYDVLNYSNSSWENPFTKDISKDSFIDLYNKSIPNAVEFMEIIFSYINHDRDINTILEFVDDISYDTGRNCKFTFSEKNKRT
jgi:hypothetical protein